MASPVLNGSFNGFDDHIDDLVGVHSPSLALINEIASSLSNHQSANRSSVPPPLPPKPCFDDAVVEKKMMTPVAEEIPNSNGENFDIPCRSSFKKVSKLGNRQPSYTFFEENVGYNNESSYVMNQPKDRKYDNGRKYSTGSINATELDNSMDAKTPCVSENAPSFESASPNIIPHITTEPPVRSHPSPVRSISSSSTISCNSANSPYTITNSPYPHGRKSRNNSTTSLHSVGGVVGNMLSNGVSCSSLRSAGGDEDPDTILLTEKRSFRPFKSSDDYLFAMKEDLAEWLHILYDLGITAENFLEKLETGEILCQVSTL